PRHRAGSRRSAVRGARKRLTPVGRIRRVDRSSCDEDIDMSDHIDGPRSIGDPSIDTTDLFCFRSPENPERTVFAADVFPSAGTSAVFTDAANHAIVARRVTVAGLGDSAKFQAG